MNTSELSRRDARAPRTRNATRWVSVEFDPSKIKPLTPEEHEARLKALEEMPEADDIDYSDIPEIDDERWEKAVKVRNPWMTPPTKTTLEKLQVDSDIIFWILNKVGEEGYQDKINAMLRRAMDEERGQRA